jgi:hypothetical protein
MHLLDMRQPGVELSNYRLYETEMVGKVDAFYRLPPLVAVSQLKTFGNFNLIAPSDDLPTLLLEQPLYHVDAMVYRAITDSAE